MEETSVEALLVKRWALLDVEFIRVTATHRCIRKLYILADNGRTELELEFYPCKQYKELEKKY